MQPVLQSFIRTEVTAGWYPRKGFREVTPLGPETASGRIIARQSPEAHGSTLEVFQSICVKFLNSRLYLLLLSE